MKPADLLPAPPDCGLPPAFTSWRKSQPEAVTFLLESEKPFSALNLPTGVGKSAIYMGWSQLSGHLRTAFLTSTRGLSDQLLRDFSATGMRDVRGGNNYWCGVLADHSMLGNAARTGPPPQHLACDRGPCRGGEECDLRMGGCRYYDAVRHAAGGRFPSTNYSYWMHQRRYADAALGSVGALVCDEAHDITEQVASFLRTEIRLSEVRAFSPASPWPEPSARLHHWRVWASKAEEALPSADSYAATPEVVRRLRTLLGALGRLQEMPEGAILAQYRDHDDTRVVVEPLWPGHLSREVLFGDAERVVLSSATIRPKTMDLLSIPRSDYDWHEARSPFPVRDRPVIWVKGAGRIDSKSRSWFPGWIRKIDAVIRANQDRKGIIHSVSYARAREIQGASSYGARMLTHERRNAAQVIAEFKAREEPCILVSPIVTTGYDFPGTEAEFNIIPKIPFPVTHGDPVMEARCKADKSYRDYITMVAVVQAVGRVNRYVGDRGMTVILDDHWQWFREKARRHAPDFFWQAESVSSRVPEPLEKL